MNRLGPTAVSGDRTFAEISAGTDHTCAWTAAGLAGYCWGSGSYGQLGEGTPTFFRPTPTRVVIRFQG